MFITLTVICFFNYSGSTRLKSEETEENGTEKTRYLYTEKWKDVYDWADKSTLGDQYTYCISCDRNLTTSHKGVYDLKRHLLTSFHIRRAKTYTGVSLRRSKSLPCSKLAFRFIHKHCYNGSGDGEKLSRHFARCKLGSHYPKDITAVCLDTPYCVYIYGGVELEKDDSVTVVLVGFFDLETSRHCIRFLDVLQSPADDAGEKTAQAVVGTLKKFELPSQNLVAVYFNGKGAATEQISSQLRELNPNTVVFGGLYNIADSACHAGVKSLSNHAQELMVHMYAHYISCSTKDDNLKALFGSDITGDLPSFHLNTTCLNFCQLVSKILEMWTDLILYFSSCDRDHDKVKMICSQLQDPKIRATFMFLEQALKPLHDFQRQIQTNKGATREDLLLFLEEASSLLCTYTSYFLCPHAAARFLNEGDAKILQNKTFYLSSPELSLGGKAVEDFLKESNAAEALPHLQEEVLSFYIALTEGIAAELPLTDWVLSSMTQMLKPQSRLKVSAKNVGELGRTFGICSSAEEVKQLTNEFLEYQLAEKGESEDEEKDISSVVSLEKHWSSVLKETKPTSIFRKLVFTLLCLPCPPLDAQLIFTQVCKQKGNVNICCLYLDFMCLINYMHILYILSQALENGKDDLFSESEALTESESDFMSDSTVFDNKGSPASITDKNRTSSPGNAIN